MSKRQALGVLTNQTNGFAGKSAGNIAAASTAAAAVNSKQIKTTASASTQAGIKSSASNNNLLLSQFNFNDENEPPQFVLSSLKAQAKDLDFEIFQEEQSKQSKSQALNQQTNQFVPVNFKQNEPSKLKEALNDGPSNLFFASDKSEKQSNKENVEDDDEDDEDENEDENDEDDDDDDEEEDDDICNKENDEQVLEEEGISRLNLVAMGTDSLSSCAAAPSSSSTNGANTSGELMMIMDASSSTHNDSSSPMMLDDTIKFLSKIEGHDEADCDDDEDNDDKEVAYDEEDDEETRRKLDAAERENVLMNCLEYKDEILAYMKSLEREQRPKSSYMKKQLDITSSMRSILVDWLVEVCEEYKLHAETLYLAVNYTDRFLSQMSVLRGKLQLVGTASMYIASKYEEITPPDVSEFVYITDDTYTKKQVLRMEHLLLKVLDFRMSPPTINWFLSHYLRFIKLQTDLSHPNNADKYNRIDNLSRYIAELTLIDSDTYLSYLPSQVATSAIYLAFYTMNRPWTKQIADICGYAHDMSELKSCVQEMFKTMKAAYTHPQQAIQEKYKQSKYDFVAFIEPRTSLVASLMQ